MRRAAGIAALAILLVAAPAQAAPPVVGGATFNDAPLLAPGSHADGVNTGGAVFYKVRLAPRQQLNAAVSLDVGGLDTSLTGASSLVVKLYDPLRQQVTEAQTLGPGDATTHLKSTDATLGPVAQGGIYYLSAAVNDFLPQGSVRAELPLQVALGVATNAAAPARGARASSKRASGTSWGVFAALCAAGALLGVGGGIAVRRR